MACMTPACIFHLSQAHQVRTVLDASYAGQPDLVLLLVVPQLLRSPLRFEAPSTLPHAPGALLPDASRLFPHQAATIRRLAVNGRALAMPAGFAP